MSSRQYVYKTWGSMNNDPDMKIKTVQETFQAQQTQQENNNSKIIELKDINHLKFALKSNRFVIVKVEADWCQPCKMLQKPYQDLAAKCESCGLFAYFTDDVDKESSCHAGKVDAVPTFFVYTDGDMEPKKKYQGDFKQLENLVDKILERISEANNGQNNKAPEPETNKLALMGQSNYLNPSVMQVPTKSKIVQQNEFDKTLEQYNQQTKNTANQDEQITFVKSEKYVGSKKGWVFKNDEKGLGYYRDIKA